MTIFSRFESRSCQVQGTLNCYWNQWKLKVSSALHHWAPTFCMHFSLVFCTQERFCFYLSVLPFVQPVLRSIPSLPSVKASCDCHHLPQGQRGAHVDHSKADTKAVLSIAH